MVAKQTQYYDTPIPNEGIMFNPDAFDAAIRANGATLVHHKALKCPLGLIDPMDERRPHADHHFCSNGNIYKIAGVVTASWGNNNARNALKDFGNIDSGTVSVTFPLTYDDNDIPVVVAPYDRFYFKDPVGFMENKDIVEAHRTGIDRLQFPATEVVHLIDANGIEYSLGDFTIDNGNIKWLNSKRPSFDPKINKGTIYSIRYKFQPFFYVKSLVHEIRIARVPHMDGSSGMQRMPFAVVLQREIVFENAENNPKAPADMRKEHAPEDGGFGAR